MRRMWLIWHPIPARRGAACTLLGGLALAAAGASRPAPGAASFPRHAAVATLRQAPGPSGTMVMIRFDYRIGTAARVVATARGGTVLAEQRLPGRPQGSRDELREAVGWLEQDRRLARLLRGGAVTEGGFIVDGPPGSSDRHRYIQVRILSPSRRDLLQVVVVDLTAGRVAAARDSFE